MPGGAASHLQVIVGRGIHRGPTSTSVECRRFAAPVPASSAPTSWAARPRRPPGPTGRVVDVILVVDDEEAVRTTLARVLDRAGHETVPAANAEPAQTMVDP